MKIKLRGKSYLKRVRDINKIYDEHVKSGLSNREIWRRYIYPIYPISERTLYQTLKMAYLVDESADETEAEMPPKVVQEDLFGSHD